MKSMKNMFCLTGAAACIGLLLFVATTYGADVIIGNNSTDVGRMVIISPKAGDTASANGTALLNTLAGITADVDNPYLIKLGPGTYDLGSTGLQMKAYVSIEGSGEEATKLTAAVSTTSWPDVATVIGVSNAGLRSLTVENTGTGTYTTAIVNSSASPSLIHVTATASGGTVNYGIYNSASSPAMRSVTATASGGSVTYGIYNNSSSPAMTDVTVTASGFTVSNYGILNYSSSPTMTNVTVTASGGTNGYGVYNAFSSLTMTNVTATASGGTNGYGVCNFATSGSNTILIDRCSFTGSSGSILNDTEFTLKIGASKLDGSINSGTGTFICAGSYNGSYAALGTDCL